MEFQFSKVENGACPYLRNRNWTTHAFRTELMPVSIYQELIDHGWRRSGDIFYRNACSGCAACIPLRVPVAGFKASKSQRRVLRRNEDVQTTILPTAYSPELYDLYRRYQDARHPEDHDTGTEDFTRFLCTSPVTTAVTLYRVGERLIGAGWIDVLPNSLSSVYFVFDPNEQQRSLGSFSVLHEIDLCRRMGRTYYHLGFWVDGCRKMQYKSAFKPHEILTDKGWQA
jgi:leucyl-tRNA---protein transferase